LRIERILPALTVVAALVPAGTAAAAADPQPGTIVFEAGGSNMGLCSAYLGATLKVRDDVNQQIRLFGDALGISNPGELYKIRARQPVVLPPELECLPRRQP
jgi:hypothetical protein